MPLTRDFKETVKSRSDRDPAFREALLEEGVERLLSGDMDTARQFCAITSTPRSDLASSAF